MIELFLLFIFYQYYKIEEEHIRTNIFLEMKNYSLSFDDERFDTWFDNLTKEQHTVVKTFEVYRGHYEHLD